MKSEVTSFQIDDVKAGKYKATFLGRKGPFPAAQGNMIFWEFLVEVDGEEMTVSGVSSDSFNHDPRCKAMKWALLIDPTFTEDKTEWDDEKAIGNEIGIKVTYFERGETLTPTVEELFTWQGKDQDT